MAMPTPTVARRLFVALAVASTSVVFAAVLQHVQSPTSKPNLRLKLKLRRGQGAKQWRQSRVSRGLLVKSPMGPEYFGFSNVVAVAGSVN